MTRATEAAAADHLGGLRDGPRAWTKARRLKARHMQLAWTTLGTLMLAGLSIMLVAGGAFSDPRIFN